jgi:drug/metabolite transporter (DMT)-like permease
MRKLNENTMACFLNPFQTIISFYILNEYGLESFGVIYRVFTTDPKSSLLFLTAGTLNYFQQTLKFKAYQHEEASKLTVFGYMAIPLQLFYDVILIKSPISLYLGIGVALNMGIYVWKFK